MTPSERAAFVAGFERAKSAALAELEDEYRRLTSTGVIANGWTFMYGPLKQRLEALAPATPPAPEASGDKATTWTASEQQLAREVGLTLPENKPAPTPPVCSHCNDTHRMPFGEDHGDVMCTRCPTPCQRCRAGGNGPYCATTPCACLCHLSIAFIDGMRPAVERQRAEQYGDVTPAPSTVDDTSDDAVSKAFYDECEEAGYLAPHRARAIVKPILDALRTDLREARETLAEGCRNCETVEAERDHWVETGATIGAQRDEMHAQCLELLTERDALRKQVAELQAALELYAVFRGADDDGGEHDECALCEANWPAEDAAKHDTDCVLRAASAPDSAVSVAAGETETVKP